MTNDEITTEELLTLGLSRSVSFESAVNPALEAGDVIAVDYGDGLVERHILMRVVPEQQADLAAVMDAFGLAPSLEGLTAEEQIANLTRQRDAWRHDALTAEQRIDALNERLADRDAQLDQAKTARARDLVRYSQDEMFLRLMAAEADRDAAEAALAQLTGITPLPAAPVGGQAEPSDGEMLLAARSFDGMAEDCDNNAADLGELTRPRWAGKAEGLRWAAEELRHRVEKARHVRAAAVSGEHQDATEPGEVQR